MNMSFQIIIIFLLLFSAKTVLAKIRNLQIELGQKMSAPRWEYGEIKLHNLKGHARTLAEIKNDFNKSNYKGCLDKVSKSQSQMLSLKAWLSYMAIKCARHIVQKQKAGFNELKDWTVLVDKNKDWWLAGGQRKLLIEEYMLAQVALFDHYITHSRDQAWLTFDKIIQNKEFLNDEELAAVFKKAGSLSFLQQDLVNAFDFFSRSLQLRNDAEINSKLKSIREILIGKKLILPSNSKEQKNIKIHLEATERENQMAEQMRVALAAGDYLPAVADGIRLINEFPSGQRSKEAEKSLLQVYINVADKKSEKYQPIKEQMFQNLQKVNGQKLHEWAKYLFNRNVHREAHKFFASAVDKMAGDKDLTEVYSLWGQSLVYIGSYEQAVVAFQKAIEVGAGSDSAERSLFLLGLTYFQIGQLSEAAAQLERLLASRSNSAYEVRSYYWLWRCLQNIDEKRADEVGRELFTRFPLTYYGLRARFEMEGESIHWLTKSDGERNILIINLTDTEYLAWEKALWLLSGGWFEEAQAELTILPPVYIATSKLVMAYIWNRAFDHYRSISLLNQVWDLGPNLLTLTNLKMGFPQEFKSSVEKSASDNKLEKEILWSLIRQESSFRRSAKSSAGALGLMQLMPATAREVSQRLRIAPLGLPEDAFAPEKNIRMGTSYLAQLLRAFDGHLPLALAAYNVGIGNMRKWTRLRSGLEKLSLTKTSNFKEEIWIDQLPWAETSHYVKAVLRNLIIYRMIQQEKLVLKDPIW